MQLAVVPDQSAWLVVPEFPPPGWARSEARTRSHLLMAPDPMWRDRFERLLEVLCRSERTPSMARLLHVCDSGESVFAVDLSVARVRDDNSKEGRRATQKAILAKAVPGARPQRLRPDAQTAGFWALSVDPAAGPMDRPSAVIVLRKGGLPTVPVDLIMTVWGATTLDVEPHIPEVIRLADAVGPAT